ncbi:cellulose binding domain-containing protein [Sphaerisporangium aureirubrum]|uniref:Cellulose binding domain-containing protein n=2 Tax=Sphaerisporangium aureirubrum TaxID=1544736 RepID=A0ABW1NS96_9ACTN
MAAGLAAVPAARAATTADTTPPTRPTNLTACPVPGSGSSAYASICWTASTDNVAVTGYDIYRLEQTGFVKAASTTGTVGGFSGVYGRHYTMYVVAKDAAGNVSPPSTLITVSASTGTPPPTPTPTPTPPGDVTAPSQPSGLREPCLADYPGVSFCWNASTDNVAVTAYDVYRETPGGWLRAGTVPTPTGTFPLHFYESSGLVTGTRYVYVVVAKDAAGNLSVPSLPFSALARQGLPRPPTPTPTPTPSLSCSVGYAMNVWYNGLTASITLKNTGTTNIDGWILIVEFSSSNFILTSGWSGDVIQDGNKIIFKNLPWNKVIQPNMTIQLGFSASYTGTPPSPMRSTLNGVPCTG